MKKLRYILEFILVKTLFTIIKIFPHSALFAVSSTIGRMIFLLPTISKLTTANVKTCFPEKSRKESKSIARKSMINIVQTFLEFVWFSGSKKRLKAHFQSPLNIEELAKEKTKDGKGFIYVVPHLGNWELAGLICSYLSKTPFAAVARTMNNPYLNKLIVENRTTEGTKIINAKGAVKGMMKALADGYIVATLIDQNTRCRDGGIWTDMFGLPVPTSRAPAMFARKRGCEIAVGGCVREGKKYVTFTEELPRPVSEYRSDEEITQALITATENVIRKYPEQYMWLYKRFQHIPETTNTETADKYPYYSEVVKPRFYSTKVPKSENFFE